MAREGDMHEETRHYRGRCRNRRYTRAACRRRDGGPGGKGWRGSQLPLVSPYFAGPKVSATTHRSASRAERERALVQAGVSWKWDIARTRNNRGPQWPARQPVAACVRQTSAGGSSHYDRDILRCSFTWFELLQVRVEIPLHMQADWRSSQPVGCVAPRLAIICHRTSRCGRSKPRLAELNGCLRFQSANTVFVVLLQLSCKVSGPPDAPTRPVLRPTSFTRRGNADSIVGGADGRGREVCGSITPSPWSPPALVRPPPPSTPLPTHAFHSLRCFPGLYKQLGWCGSSGSLPSLARLG